MTTDQAKEEIKKIFQEVCFYYNLVSLSTYHTEDANQPETLQKLEQNYVDMVKRFDALHWAEIKYFFQKDYEEVKDYIIQQSKEHIKEVNNSPFGKEEQISCYAPIDGHIMFQGKINEVAPAYMLFVYNIFGIDYDDDTFTEEISDQEGTYSSDNQKNNVYNLPEQQIGRYFFLTAPAISKKLDFITSIPELEHRDVKAIQVAWNKASSIKKYITFIPLKPYVNNEIMMKLKETLK